MSESPTLTGSGGIEVPRDKGLVARLLSPIADVRDDEVLSALLMTLTMFLILAGYYLLKTAREQFILSEGGAEVKSYSSAGQAVLLLFLVPAYGAFASKVNRVQLIQWVTLFFVANLGLFLVALWAGLRIGIVYFIWVGIFNVMVIAQLWAFANDLYTEDQGKRLFPLIGVGSSLGAWFGSMRAGTLVQSFGPSRLLLGGAAILIICIALTRIVDRVSTSGGASQAKRSTDKLEGGKGGFAMILSDRYLMLIAVLVLVLNVVNTTGEYLFGRYVVQAAQQLSSDPATRQAYIGETYSSYFSYVNFIGFVLQMFVVSRVFKVLGVGRTLFIHPIVVLSGYLIMLKAPSFDAIRWLKVADNSIDYSLGNTTKQALWLPTSREAKYKAKQAVDSFCMRAGDVVQAGIVYAGELVNLSTGGFVAVGAAFAFGWLSVAFGLRNQLAARARASGRTEL
ncbi:MAG TPA: Npt1/Npt2 family nucleotide transporter [Vicinamibacterales bacterium]|jgi:AAA family ATP:ADP antiporter